MIAEGFIAFQVHSIKNNKERDGLQVRWRDARILTENLEANGWPLAEHATEFSFLKNELTPSEIRKGWRFLWDGKTTEGWRGAKSDEFPEFGWEIKEGVLSVLVPLVLGKISIKMCGAPCFDNWLLWGI